MTAWMCGLALAAVPVLGGQPGVALAPMAPIALYSGFEQEPPEAVKTALDDELDSIMTPLGLRFEWRDLHAARMGEPAVELAVVSFKGRCDTAGLVRRAATPGPLGWTHISDGSILPFSGVDCGGIRAFLQSDLLALPAAARDAAFGRALARVLAHELYHIFADTTHHGSFGIGKEAYSARDLLAGNFRFENRESKALRNGKAYGALGKGFVPRQ
jgi:hypothetical protein